MQSFKMLGNMYSPFCLPLIKEASWKDTSLHQDLYSPLNNDMEVIYLRGPAKIREVVFDNIGPNVWYKNQLLKDKSFGDSIQRATAIITGSVGPILEWGRILLIKVPPQKTVLVYSEDTVYSKAFDRFIVTTETKPDSVSWFDSQQEYQIINNEEESKIYLIVDARLDPDISNQLRSRD